MFARTLLVSLVFAAPLVAAPPGVTTLTPSGGARGTSVAVVATGTFDTWPVQVWSSAPGVTVRAEKDKGKFSVAVAERAPLGVTWLRFHDDAGASPLRPFVVGALPEVNETEPNDDAKAAPPVAMPAVVNGVLSKTGDVDCFTVKLKKGETLVASLEAHRTLRSPIDAVLQVVSAEGTVLEQNHDARGLDPEVTYTAPADGSYGVRLFAFPAQPDSSIRHFGSPACVYRLTLTAGEFVDFVTPLAVERDRDATLALTGWNLTAKTAKLAKSDETFGAARPFAVAREPHPCFDLTGNDEPPLSPPFTATGRVAKAGTPSVVRVAGTAGQALAIRLDSARLGLSLTPVLRVTDTTGKPLVRAEPGEFGGPIETTFTPPTTGTYTIEVRDLFNSAGARHVYRLQLTRPVADVVAKVAADRFTLTAGTPLDVAITIARKGGFAGELIPFADPLPDGVTAAPVAPAKPDPNTVVLRLTATKPGVGGAIRFGVQSKGDPNFRRNAVATLAEFDTTTTDVWVTVVAPNKK